MCLLHTTSNSMTSNFMNFGFITSFLCPALAEHTVFVVSVRNGSQLTGVPWDLRLAGHTSATHTFLVLQFIFLMEFIFTSFECFGYLRFKNFFRSLLQIIAPWKIPAFYKRFPGRNELFQYASVGILPPCLLFRPDRTLRIPHFNFSGFYSHFPISRL